MGACAFVKAEAIFPENSLIVGTPAKVLRALSDKEIAWKTSGTKDYQNLVTRCLNTFKEVEPLKEIETNRPTLSFENVIPKSQL